MFKKREKKQTEIGELNVSNEDWQQEVKHNTKGNQIRRGIQISQKNDQSNDNALFEQKLKQSQQIFHNNVPKNDVILVDVINLEKEEKSKQNQFKTKHQKEIESEIKEIQQDQKNQKQMLTRTSQIYQNKESYFDFIDEGSQSDDPNQDQNQQNQQLLNCQCQQQSHDLSCIQMHLQSEIFQLKKENEEMTKENQILQEQMKAIQQEISKLEEKQNENYQAEMILQN